MAGLKGMKNIYPGWYPKSQAEALSIWEQAIFVPDANVLLHCLRHKSEIREDLLRLLEALSDSLWIPYQVGAEFHRNRLSVEFGAMDAYDLLLKDQESNFDRARDRLRQVRAHPTIDVQHELLKLDDFVEGFRTRIEGARSSHPVDDVGKVLDRLSNILEGRVGSQWPAEKLAALRKEGEDRYAKKIPPGFRDIKKDAGDLDKFGDLIIWKDLIAKAKNDGRPVIFISDDAKEDWWWIYRGKKIGPRPELVEEFLAGSDQHFHMYDFAQFLRFAAERLPADSGGVVAVEESVLADEEARRRLEEAIDVAEKLEKLRALEDEREYMSRLLSGLPSRASGEGEDRQELVNRLAEVNSEIGRLMLDVGS